MEGYKMKLILINYYLQRFDTLRMNPLENINELEELHHEIYSIIESHTKKHKTEDVFTDILNHIALDVNYEQEKACDQLNINNDEV